MSGALERRLKPKEEKKHKKEKKEKKHKKEKKKKHSSHRNDSAPAPTGAASDSDSSSDAEPEGGGGGGGDSGSGVGGDEQVAPPPAIAPVRTKAEGIQARAAAGLDWMQRQPARVDSRGDAPAPAPPPQDAAAVAAAEAAKTRIARELNPYAAEGREVNDWTHEKHGEAGSHPAGSVRGPGMGDGGQSFLLKKMARAVEEAEQSARPLEQVCP